MGDLFRECKERVALGEVARLYGFEPNRTGFIRCPFHKERTPSLKLNPNGRWHCFGCGEGGDVVDFTAALFNLGKLAAVDKLNDDLRLGLSIRREPTPAERQAARKCQEIAALHERFEAWRTDFINKLNAVHRVGWLIMQGLERPEDVDKLTGTEVEAVRRMAQASYLADVLANGSAEEQIGIFRGRKEAEAWIGKISNSSPQSSRTA